MVVLSLFLWAPVREAIAFLFFPALLELLGMRLGSEALVLPAPRGCLLPLPLGFLSVTFTSLRRTGAGHQCRVLMVGERTGARGPSLLGHLRWGSPAADVGQRWPWCPDTWAVVRPLGSSPVLVVHVWSGGAPSYLLVENHEVSPQASAPVRWDLGGKVGN